MTHPTRPDEDMDDLGPDLDALGARYQADSHGIEPPHHLDAQLLAAAHRAVDARPRAPGAAPARSTSVMRRLRAPFGLAATIVAIASITVALWKESPEKLEIPSDHAPAVPVPKVPKATVGQQSNSSGAVAVTILPGPAGAPAPSLFDAAPAPARQKEKEESRARQGLYAEGAANGPALPSPKKMQSGEAKAAIASDNSVTAGAPSQQSLDWVTVTGSNLKRADTETPSPVQILTLPEAAPVSSSPAPTASAQVVAPSAPAALAGAAPPALPDVASAARPAAPIAPSAPTAASSSPQPVPAPSPSLPAPYTSRLAAAQALAPPAPAPAPALPLATRSAEPAPPPPAAARVPAPAIAYASPPTASGELRKPNAAPLAAATPPPGEPFLLSALQTAADAGDAAAAHVVLETLKKNFPQAQIPAALRVELQRLGISIPEGR